eukprot:gene11475-12509_t
MTEVVEVTNNLLLPNNNQIHLDESPESLVNSNNNLSNPWDMLTAVVSRDKLRLEYGPEVFSNGCPVCKDLCCCSNKSVNCTRKFHCYRKCPATKIMNSKTCLPVSTASSPSASAMTMPSNNDGSNDETTSVEENSSNNSIIGQKQHRMNALLEACANLDEKPVDEEDVAQRKSNKRQKTMKSQDLILPVLAVDPSAAPATKTKKEKKNAASSATNTIQVPTNAMSMASYPMSFYGFPHTAMAAAGPYGMIPLVPAHMLSGYNLPAQYSKMAALDATEENEENPALMYGKGVPPLIPVFPYYMPQYAATAMHATKNSNIKSKSAPLTVPSVNGINLLAAVSSHYLTDEEENASKHVVATAEIPSN